MTTSKSPKAGAAWAYAIALQALPLYSHHKSPHIYTQAQLFALLVLKQFFKKDYRGLVEIVKDFSDLQEVLELTRTPHYTTLQKAAKRLLNSKNVQKLLKETLHAAVATDTLPPTSTLCAMDSTGLETGHISKYFVTRKQRERHKQGYQTTTYKRFPKLAHVCDCFSHIILGFLTSRGPSVDVIHFKQLLTKAHSNHPLDTITADAGYDSESNHVFAREKYGIHSIINPRIGRPSTKLPKGKYRREMKTEFPKESYGQRWQSETVMFMIKRNLGESLFSRTYWGQSREMSLKVLTHNIMIVW